MHILNDLTVHASCILLGFMLYSYMGFREKNVLAMFKVLFKMDVSEHDLGNYLV